MLRYSAPKAAAAVGELIMIGATCTCAVNVLVPRHRTAVYITLDIGSTTEQYSRTLLVVQYMYNTLYRKTDSYPVIQGKLGLL